MVAEEKGEVGGLLETQKISRNQENMIAALLKGMGFLGKLEGGLWT